MPRKRVPKAAVRLQKIMDDLQATDPVEAMAKEIARKAIVETRIVELEARLKKLRREISNLRLDREWLIGRIEQLTTGEHVSLLL